jgi:hypothetical protein
MNKNISDLVVKLAEKYNYNKGVVLKDVIKAESVIHCKYSRGDLSKSYFYTAVGVVSKKYKDFNSLLDSYAW